MHRGYGILLPVFSLPDGHGIGDFGPASYRFVDLLADHGVTYWQILPLSAGNPGNGESPYFSTSAFAINPLLISLERLKNDGLLSAKEIADVPPFPADSIFYAKVRAVAMPLLEKAALRFQGSAAFDLFCQSNRHWLETFAAFEVLRDTNEVPWIEWRQSLRERDPRAVGDFVAGHQGEIRAAKILQFFAITQWHDVHRYCTDRNIAIIGDMPIYVAHDSADTWTNPALFKLDADGRPLAVSGVPPDFFSATGQLWNNPVYNWESHEADGFSWWVERMRHLFSLYDIVRIDHFRGLVQYWEILSGETTAVNGEWKDVPTYSLFDTLVKEFKPFPVICEDLGVITGDVRAVMKHYGFPGMKVLQFAFGDDDPQNPYLPHNYDTSCIVYTGTHDNMPTRGWLTKVVNADEHERVRRCTGRVSDDAETVWDLIELAMKSNAAVAVFPLQDILTMGENARINDPATLPGNWRWRWNPSLNPSREAFSRLLDLGRKYGR